jgi:hypothetical protein
MSKAHSKRDAYDSVSRGRGYVHVVRVHSDPGGNGSHKPELSRSSTFNGPLQHRLGQ